ncbi:MAG: Ivy family c-type lysozyme inhibitor [Acetobacter syzygii]
MRFSLLLLSALGLATPAFADELPVTAEFAAQPKFAPAYHAMSTLPPWVSGLKATSVPVEKTSIDGKPYLLGHMCKPHDCADYQLEVIFTPDGHKAWGFLSVVNNGTLYQMPLGEPTQPVLEALKAAYNTNNPDRLGSGSSTGKTAPASP